VDEVFNQGDPVQKLTSSPSSTTLMAASFQRNSVEDEDRFMNVLHKVAVLCKARGVVIKHCYTDLDRAAIPNPSRTNPRTGGKVSKNQFVRNFPFRKEFSEGDLNLLAERYRVGGPDGTAAGDVHFMALHNDVTEAMEHEMPPFPRSDLYLKPDDTEWSHHTLHPVQKIQAKVVEKRVRLTEYFQDFDALRKGVCTVGQVKTVLTLTNLGKEINRNDFDALVNSYIRDDGMFCYKDFCKDVETAFSVPGLEKNPMAMTVMPDASTTECGRRNRIVMTPTRKSKVSEILTKMATRVRKRGVYMKMGFKDMDRANRGHVSRNQFARIVHTYGFELDEIAIGLLCCEFCDLGNHNDFNYVAFLRAVDPPNQDVELAMEQATRPHQGFRCSNYFDERGSIKPFSRSASTPLLGC
jgi:Ca2+-binding EF-hand superfamily protein